MEVHVVRTDVRTPQQFVKGKEFSLRMKGKFWSILLPLFYLEGIYLPTLQQQARLWQLNYYVSLWFTQMCLCRFYFPLLLRLANDFETNPVDQRSGPRPLPISPYVTCSYVRARLRTKRSVPLVNIRSFSHPA